MHTPEHLLDIIATITTILLTRLKLPNQEIEEFVSLIKEKKMPELFEKFEEVDVPKMRQEIQKEREELRKERREIQEEKREIQEEKREIQEEKREIQEERRFLEEQRTAMKKKEETLKVAEEDIGDKIMVKNICKLFRKGYSPDSIAELLEASVEMAGTICHLTEQCASDHDVYSLWQSRKQRS